MGTRGGRTKTTWEPTWKHGKTRTIRVPVALAETIIEVARKIDEGSLKVDELLNTSDSLDTGNPC
ncbi:MAG: hypothetical protein ACRCZS_15965 [Chroococcidiopsis sp.]